jgi:hypothetical protein
MNPDLEIFLENTFKSLEPMLPGVGRVVVEPNYEADLSQVDARSLLTELTNLLRSQSPDRERLLTHEGVEIPIPQSYPTLLCYARRIVLHHEAADGPWIEVAPPGNWI